MSVRAPVPGTFLLSWGPQAGRPRIWRAFAAGVALLTAATAVQAAADTGAFDVTLGVGQALQRCVTLAAGEPAAYRFAADAPVQFAIRDRAAPVDVPVALAREGVVNLSLSFRPPRDGDWCFVWRNAGSLPARIVGAIERPGR